MVLEIVRWVLVVGLSAVGALAVAGNWAGFLAWQRKREPSSLVPLVGGLSLAIALAISPARSVGAFWWLPLLIDLGCTPLLVVMICFRVRGGNRTASEKPGG